MSKETEISDKRAFPNTRWSLVIDTRNDDESSQAEALADLCHRYWYPLYGFARRSGKSHADAQDLTQAFFEKLLSRDGLRTADPEKGRFRSFLLAAFKHFMTDEWRKDNTDQRGGNYDFLSFEHDDAEERFAEEQGETHQPEMQFDRQWALTILEAANDRLEQDYQSASKGELHNALRPYLLERGAQTYAKLAEQVGISEGAVTMAIQRMRKRLGDLIREEVMETVSSHKEVEDEVRWLMTVLSDTAA